MTYSRAALGAVRADADALRAAWARIGALFAVAPMREAVDLEDLICATAMMAREDQRLFVVPASWLAVHHHLLDARRLGRRIDVLGQPESATLGALLSLAASEAPGRTAIASAIEHCRALERAEPLFPVVARSPGLVRLLKEDALPLFRQWGFWHDDASLQLSAIRPVQWILEQCPELRFRLLVGPGTDAEVLRQAAEGPMNIAELARRSEASYAAAHAAVQRLASRGLLAERAGVWTLGPTIAIVPGPLGARSTARPSSTPMPSRRRQAQR